eukprot:6116636-Alexandrium_andersonii.AAC.1
MATCRQEASTRRSSRRTRARASASVKGAGAWVHDHRGPSSQAPASCGAPPTRAPPRLRARHK